MKKSLALICGLVAALALGVSAQTITLSGTNSVGAAGQAFATPITLTISGTNTIGNVSSVNALLATPSTGANSGVSYFTITGVTPAAGFTNTNSTSYPTGFGITGDTLNSGSNVDGTSPAGYVDVGVNSTTPPAVSSGGAAFLVETLTLQAAAGTPAGVYNFYFTQGGFADTQGTYISNSSNANFDVTQTPVFTVTIVPEPATWSLMALGGLGTIGMTVLRRRRA